MPECRRLGLFLHKGLSRREEEVGVLHAGYHAVHPLR